MRPVTPVLLAWIGFLMPSAAVGGQVCTIPASVAGVVPDTVPAPAPYGTIRDAGVPFADIDLGIGHLRPTESTWTGDWLDRTALPLSESPGASPWGWIARGWIVDVAEGVGAPWSRSGLVETGYEDATLIVFERGDGGWLRIRFAAEDVSERVAGTAWIPPCALAGDVELELEPWGELFLSDRISPLFFRSDEPQALRSDARSDSERIASIEGDYHLEPLQIRGEWMRVMMKQPSDACAGDVEPAATTGWIQWRSPERGPRLWYHSRGC